jgi:uncharacterized protein YecA (UPF0149 family)
MLNERVAPIAMLARLGYDDPELQELPSDQQKIAQLNDGTAESAAAIDAYSRSIADGPRHPFRRQTAKVGRNDPCPYGRGTTYKKCYGAAASPH